MAVNSTANLSLPAPASAHHHPGHHGERVAIKIAAVAAVAALSYGAVRTTAVPTRRPDEDSEPVPAVEVVEVTRPVFIPADAEHPGGQLVPGTSPPVLAPMPLDFGLGPSLDQLQAADSPATPAPAEATPAAAGQVTTPAAPAPAPPASAAPPPAAAPGASGPPPAPAVTPAAQPAAAAPVGTPTAAETPAAVEAQRVFYIPEVSHGPATTIELNLFNEINAERAKAGLEPYAYDTGLSILARIRAKQMADQGYFGHRDPYGYMMYVELLSRENYWYRWAGENLARNNYSAAEAAQRAVISLMNSGPHRANLLDTDFDRIGVGIYTTADGVHYMAMIFLG